MALCENVPHGVRSCRWRVPKVCCCMGAALRYQNHCVPIKRHDRPTDRSTDRPIDRSTDRPMDKQWYSSWHPTRMMPSSTATYHRPPAARSLHAFAFTIVSVTTLHDFPMFSQETIYDFSYFMKKIFMILFRFSMEYVHALVMFFCGRSPCFLHASIDTHNQSCCTTHNDSRCNRKSL